MPVIISSYEILE